MWRGAEAAFAEATPAACTAARCGWFLADEGHDAEIVAAAAY